jgi:ribonucleoside-diphosphate reductase alpha chain
VNIVKRDGAIVPFDKQKIALAVQRCFDSLPEDQRPMLGGSANLVTKKVANIVGAKYQQPTVEQIQDLVEQQLMAIGQFDAAKAYILYRSQHEALRGEFGLTAEEAAIVHGDRKYFATQLQQFQFKDKYSRWSDEKGRRETWEETVDRVIGFFKSQLVKKQADPFGGTSIRPEEWDEMRSAILNMEAFPSMRVMQMAGPALDRCHVGVYNCAFVGFAKLDDFAEFLYVLMQGTGAGDSVESLFIEDLPRIKKQKKGGDVPTHVIPDSTVGWCDALKLGLHTWFDGRDVEFDYSQIRPAGTPLKTKGGRASGPEPLKRLLNFTRDKIRSRQGARLRPVDVQDIANMCGDIVQVGGVRRAAIISLSDLHDQEMRLAKSGNWFQATPWRAMANNSAVYEEKPSAEQFIDEFLSLIRSRSGERGIFNRGSLPTQIPKRRKKDQAFGCNPCGEIILRSKQFCNLSIAVAREDDTIESLERKVRIATLFGTLQSMLTDFEYLGPEWKKNCEEERLLGVDINGQFDCPLLRYGRHTPDRLCRAGLLLRLKKLAVLANEHYAARLGIEPSAAITCVKPGGNSSVLLNASAGMHPRMFKHFVRRVTVSADSPMAKVLSDAGVPSVRSNEANLLFEFPERTPDGAMTEGDLSAVDQLENWLDWKLYFTEHNPSVTVKVAEDEWLKVAHWVYEHWEHIGGLTFLQKQTEDTVYQGFLPYESITAEEYERRVASMPVVDYAKLARYEREDMTTLSKDFACVSGICNLP